jgi:hypothetical protein
MQPATHPSFESFVARLSELERSNRRLRKFMLAIVALSVVGLFTAAKAQESRTVEAEKFVLVDSRGTVKAVLESKDATTALKFFDEQSRPVAEFSVDKNGPAIGLQSASGESLTLSATKESTGMAVVNAKTQIAVALGVAKRAGADFILRDENGKTLFHKP